MAVIGFLYSTAPNLGLQARKGAPRETTFRRRREARGHRGQRSHQHGARGMGIRLQVSHVLLQITFACYWCLKIDNCPFTASRRHCGQMNEHTGCSSWPTHTGALQGGKGMKLRERTTFWMRIVASGTLFSKMLGFSIKCHGSRSVSRYPLLCCFGGSASSHVYHSTSRNCRWQWHLLHFQSKMSWKCYLVSVGWFCLSQSCR